MVGRRIEIRGVVQGVGFRPWIYRLATEQGLTGQVRNDATGVVIDAFGTEDALNRFSERLDVPPPAAVVTGVRAYTIPPQSRAGFAIVHSEETSGRRVTIPPDLPTCEACLSEILDPSNRRYRYAFTNCTNCGPRFTITRDVPYDRPVTTMAAFTMCASCQREYDDVNDRRFHAQPNACPVCGPRLRLVERDGAILACDDPIVQAAVALRAGEIVAVKGLGGFHLVCDATSPAAVRRLRLRKRRDEKPFAVMAADLEAAATLATLTPADQGLLESVERPIVLVPRLAGCALARDVAPNNLLVGLMLPYTPLHHLLMRETCRPMVMTSGNLSEEPLAYRNDEAIERLGEIADLFLLHDREIVTRCDDSVARVIAGRPVVLRRARGYVPRAVRVTPAFEVPVLACGAQLKNTFCLGMGESAYLGPHIGDLENLETNQSFEEAIARLERFLRTSPAVVAHDLHPDYLSTRYARGRGVPTVGVQHHHAHVASAMAEHGLAGPVIGVAFDGTGYGTDGTAWGGEVLLARDDGFDRLATLRPVPLAGVDAAIRHPWRIALALIEDAFDGLPPLDGLRLFSAVPPLDLAVVRQLLATRLRSPLAHGAGRYFDGVGSLVLGRPDSRFEGQIALEWNVVADPAERGIYAHDVDRRRMPWVVDLRPMIRDVVHDLRNGVTAATISGRFHNTLVAATAGVVTAVGRARTKLPVVLTGGCFQNARLAGGLAAALDRGFAVHLHGQVPPGDGGIALGQAVVAAAIARKWG